jgi:nicotinamide riboside transporter PnuC
VTFTLTEANGFLSFLLNVAGNLMLAWKWRSGWAVRIVAIVSWGVYGWEIASRPIMLNAVTFFCINCYGWWKWRKEERERESDIRRLQEAERVKAAEARWFEEQRRSA